MAVPWIQLKPYLFLQHARERTGSGTKNLFLGRRWKEYREEPVSAPTVGVMGGTLLRIQEQRHEPHQERVATMSMLIRRQCLKSTI